MTTIELTKVEERLDNHLLFNVCVYAAARRVDLPIDIVGMGAPALDETAVRRATLAFAEDLAASLRLLLNIRPASDAQGAANVQGQVRSLVMAPPPR